MSADTDILKIKIADTDADTDMLLFDTADMDADMNFLKIRGHGHGADKPRTCVSTDLWPKGTKSVLTEPGNQILATA